MKIRSKLILIILSITLFSLVAGFALVSINDINTFKREMVESTTVQARVIGDYSVVDLAFSDQEASAKTLAKLSAIENIDYAYLYDTAGKLFSSYTRSGTAPPAPPVQTNSSEFEGGYLSVFQTISEGNLIYGTILLRASTIPLEEKVRDYLLTMLSFIAVLVIASVLLAVQLQKVISAPILDLAEAARKTTEGEDYSIRVTKRGEDEVGVLYDGFNRMLEQIQHRQQERDRAEEALKSSERRFRHLVEQSHDALYVLVGRNLVFINPKFEEYLGYSVEETSSPGFDVMNLVDPSSKGLLQEREESRKRGEAVSNQYVFKAVSKSGRPYDFEANVAMIEWDGTSAILGTLRDVTERIASEEKLRQQQEQLRQYALELERSNRELDQFAYVTSHDLKAPLQAISNLSEWIEEDMGESLTGESRKHMDLLRKRAQRMVALIEGILQYSRVGRIRDKAETVDTAKLLADVVDMIVRPPGFVIHVAENMPVLETERIRLQQVFANLIGNAIKHHDRPEGRVEVTVREAGDFFEFSIADDGPGIASEYHQKIFVIFQTLKARDKFESTGVGLALVKKIVEDKGGKITLESEEGKGATFRFTWPGKPR